MKLSENLTIRYSPDEQEVLELYCQEYGAKKATVVRQLIRSLEGKLGAKIKSREKVV